MAFESQTVALTAVDFSDETFRITTETGVEVLAASLSLMGMLNAPLLVKKKGGWFAVVSGFRRIRAAMGLGWEALSARVASAATEKIECARWAVAENALQRRLNLIELSRALNLLSQFCDAAETAQNAAALGLPASPAVIEKLKCLGRLPPGVQQMIVDEVISLSMALELQRTPAAECSAFAGIFSALRLSLSKQRELFALVNEIALREEKPVLAILGEAGLRRILTDENLSRVERASAVRLYLKQRRFPTLSEAQRKFAQFRAALELGGRFQLIPPHDFEGTDYTIRLQFAGMPELESHHATIAALMKNGEFRKMLE